MGQVYWKKVYELPLASRGSRGRPIINLLPLSDGEKVNAILPIKEFVDGQFIFQATANGTVKKTPLLDYSRPRANGIRGIGLREGDKLIDVQLTDGQQDIMLFSTEGKAIRFNESLVRSMGRVATGIRGMRLKNEQQVVSLLVIPAECDDRYVLTATENGYGKRTKITEYPVKGRGGMGVMAIKTSERNGSMVGACLLDENSEMMLITNGGTIVRTRSSEVSIVGRNTQGVRLIRLTKQEKLVQLERVCETVIDEEDEVLDSSSESLIEDKVALPDNDVDEKLLEDKE
jgi:DNA gyrase subunit A